MTPAASSNNGRHHGANRGGPLDVGVATLHVGVGRAIAHHGELLQGVFEGNDHRLHRGLMTLPFATLQSLATFWPDETGTGIRTRPPGRVKAARAADLTLKHLGYADAGGDLTIESEIPLGHGYGSSTADVIASIRAAAASAGTALRRAFAFILNNFANLSSVIFDSFAGLGLQATGSPISAADLMRPGFVAAAGYDAAAPLLEEAGELMGPIAFFENFVTIMVLLFAWVVVLIAFFILAIQLFITILEFKLTTLAGFVLVPFALWNKTAFLAERVLGNVVAAGIKLMVLAVIVGIGSTLFGEFASSFSGGDITLEEAAATVLGALSIFMLGIFGPGIASGLVSGAPQLGAGAVAGSAAGLALSGAAAGGVAIGTARALGAGADNATRAAASMAGGASGSYQIARASSDASGPAGVAAGVAGVARAGAGVVGQGARNMAARATGGVRQAYADGEKGAFTATGGARSGSAAQPSAQSSTPDAPDWARRMRREQRMREGVTVAAHTLRDGDRPAAGENPKLNNPD